MRKYRLIVVFVFGVAVIFAALYSVKRWYDSKPELRIAAIVVSGHAYDSRYVGRYKPENLPNYSEFNMGAKERLDDFANEEGASGTKYKISSLDSNKNVIETRTVDFVYDNQAEDNCVAPGKCYFTLSGRFKINMKYQHSIDKIVLSRDDAILAEAPVIKYDQKPWDPEPEMLKVLDEVRKQNH